MTDPITYELDERVARITLDDGKANGLSFRSLETLQGMLDRAEKEASSVLIVGRPGRFCGGFDLSVMRGSDIDAVRGLVTAGAELFLRMFEFPLPIVTACTGHAVAAGAIILLSTDVRIGVKGDFKIGLSEVSIGMSLPIFAIELARQRLSKRHFQRATTRAELYNPDDAVDAGYLDRAVPGEELLETALAEAKALAEIPQPAFRVTKSSVPRAAVTYIRNTLAEDMGRMTGGPKAT